MLPDDIYNEVISKIRSKGADVLVNDQDKYQIRVICAPIKDYPVRIASGTGTVLDKKTVQHQFDVNLAGGIESINKSLQREGLDIHIVTKHEVSEPTYTLVKGGGVDDSPKAEGFTVAPKLELKAKKEA